MFGTPESERLKVTALNLFHPTASPSFQKWSFSYYDTVSKEGENPSLWQRKVRRDFINDVVIMLRLLIYKPDQ